MRVCGGSTSWSSGPNSASPLPVWNTIRPRTQYSTFRSCARASICPSRTGSGLARIRAMISSSPAAAPDADRPPWPSRQSPAGCESMNPAASPGCRNTRTSPGPAAAGQMGRAAWISSMQGVAGAAGRGTMWLCEVPAMIPGDTGTSCGWSGGCSSPAGHWRREEQASAIRSAGWWEAVRGTWSPAATPERRPGCGVAPWRPRWTPSRPRSLSSWPRAPGTCWSASAGGTPYLPYPRRQLATAAQVLPAQTSSPDTELSAPGQSRASQRGSLGPVQAHKLPGPAARALPGRVSPV